MKISVIAPTEIPALRANTLQVMKMAQAFVQLGHDTHLLSPFSGRTLPYRKQSRNEVNDLTWENLSNQYGIKDTFPIEWNKARRPLKRYDYGISSIQWAKRLGADLVYTRLPQAGAISSFLGLNTILELHDFPRGQIGRYLFYLFLKGKGAKRLVLISKSLAEDLQQEYGLPDSDLKDLTSYPIKMRDPAFTLIAPDGVDLERYEHIPTTSEARMNWRELTGNFLPVDGFVAGYSGHLYSGRGIGLILTLAQRLPEIYFLLIGGEPDDVAELKGIVNKRELENVFIIGFVPNSQLPGYQAMCDVLLMPYQKQVAASSGGDIANYLSPLKLFEYLACGRAILSSNLPVLQEILDDSNALLLDPQDLDNWVQSVVMLKNDPVTRSRLAKKAQQDSRQYTWISRAEKILNGIN